MKVREIIQHVSKLQRFVDEAYDYLSFVKQREFFVEKEKEIIVENAQKQHDNCVKRLRDFLDTNFVKGEDFI